MVSGGKTIFFYRVRRKSIESIPGKTELLVSQLFIIYRFLKQLLQDQSDSTQFFIEVHFFLQKWKKIVKHLSMPHWRICMIYNRDSTNLWISGVKSGCNLDKTIEVATFRINLTREQSVQVNQVGFAVKMKRRNRLDRWQEVENLRLMDQLNKANGEVRRDRQVSGLSIRKDSGSFYRQRDYRSKSNVWERFKVVLDICAF